MLPLQHVNMEWQMKMQSKLYLMFIFNYLNWKMLIIKILFWQEVCKWEKQSQDYIVTLHFHVFILTVTAL